MNNLKENVFVFFVLGVLIGSGIILCFTENWPGGIVLFLASGGTFLNMFWDEIKNYL